MKVSRGIIWEMASSNDRRDFPRFLDEGWEPYAVTHGPHGGVTHHFRRQKPVERATTLDELEKAIDKAQK